MTQGKSILSADMLAQLSVKNIKTGFGHDLMGLYADILLNNKKVGHYNDDGWGGEVDLQLETKARETITKMCEDAKFNTVLFENGWDFMGSPDKITMDKQIELVVNTLIMADLKAKEDKQFQKKLKKDFLTAIVVGVPNAKEYSFYRMPNKLTIAELKEKQAGQLRAAVFTVKNKLQKGEQILNDNLEGFL